MKTLKILFTCVGSQVAPEIINMIRDNKEYRIYVIGTDAGEKKDLVGSYFCDYFYRVPYAKDNRYISKMLEICKREKISVIFPGSDEEALLLSENRQRFLSIDTKLACSDTRSIQMSLDKCRLMKLLRENGILTADFYELNNMREIESYSRRLGFPKNDVVIKLRTARGSRGFRIVTANKDIYEKFCRNEFYYISLFQLRHIFKNNHDNIKLFFLMENLDGPKYSVDILIKQSTPVMCICRNKLFPIGSPTQLADIVYDKDIIEYAKIVASLLKFDYFVQIEVGRNKRGKPCLIEINPRIDATLPIVEGLGVNYFEQMIYYALHNTFLKKELKFAKKPLRFYRYWQHIFRKM